MFGIPLKKKEKQVKNSFLTIDIGSQSVKCLAFRSHIDPETNQSKVKLIGIGKEWLEPWSVRSGSIIELDNVISAMDKAIFKATEEIEMDIDDVIFGVSGDICDCMITTARIQRKKPDKGVNVKELEGIEAKILNNAYAKAQEKHAKKTGDYDINLELITTAIVSSKLDNIEKKALENETGTEIEMALFNAFTPRFYLTTLETIASTLNLNILAVTSNLYAINESLKIKNGEKMDSVILDAGSDTTDIAVVFNGGVVTSSSINIGGNQFTKHLSMETGLNYAEAEKRKYDYSFEKLQGEDYDITDKHLSEVTEVWLSGLEVLFSNIEGVKTFSSDIYVTGGACKLPLVLEALQNKPWTKSIPFKEPPRITKIQLEDFTHIVDTTGEANKDEYMVPLALSVIYLELNK